MTSFWSIEEALNPKVSIKEVMVRFALIGYESWLAFYMILEIKWLTKLAILSLSL